MITNTQNISTILGVTNTPPAQTTTRNSVVLVQDDTKATAENDFEFARGNLYEIIQSGQEALDDMIGFAKQAQNPRAYEVVGAMVANLVDANQKLLHLSKQIKEIQSTDKVDTSKTVNNNLFVGSTAELQKLLKGE